MNLYSRRLLPRSSAREATGTTHTSARRHREARRHPDALLSRPPSSTRLLSLSALLTPETLAPPSSPGAAVPSIVGPRRSRIAPRESRLPECLESGESAASSLTLAGLVARVCTVRASRLLRASTRHQGEAPFSFSLVPSSNVTLCIITICYGIAHRRPPPPQSPIAPPVFWLTCVSFF